MATSTIPLAMKMVIERFHFEWTRNQHGHYRVEDPVIKSFYTGTNLPDRQGVYVDRKLDAAVAAAVAVRKEHDAEMTKRSGFSTDPVTPKAAKAAPVAPPAAAPAKPKRQTRQDAANSLRATIAKTAAESAARKAARAAAAPAPVVKAPVAPARPRVMIDLDDDDDGDDPVTVIELDDVELDDTGKRERSRKEPPRRSQKENMYQSAAKVLVTNPTIKVEALATKAVLALSTAERCLQAWHEYLTALDAAGCLTAAGKRLIPSPPKKRAA